MSSLSDILTAAKNIVTAINGLGQTYLQVSGSKAFAQINVATVVMVGQGRLVRVVVTTSGSGAGAIYDAAVSTATSQKIYTIDNTGAGYAPSSSFTGLRVIDLGIPVSNGIVVAPGPGQVVTIIYS